MSLQTTPLGSLHLESSHLHHLPLPLPASFQTAHNADGASKNTEFISCSLVVMTPLSLNVPNLSHLEFIPVQIDF